MINRPSDPVIAADAPSSNRPPAFPLVGLGASAGGIQALQTFFEKMSPDSGMAFVVIMHLYCTINPAHRCPRRGFGFDQHQRQAVDQ